MMINFESFTLDNGLQVIIHEDPNSLLASVNLMYQVGSRDEEPHRTGLAHLFEHLMFSGSQHIPSYDSALQQVGGNNNAYTTADVTSYHCILPAVNLETAFWLESDRMLGLSFNKTALEIQKKVVIEEFKEVYLTQPYGDAWLQLSKLAYTQHPYQWPVIGQATSHIEQVTMEEIKTFFNKFYLPNNAVLVVAGGVNLAQVQALSQKWFGPIPAGKSVIKKFPQEPIQTAPRRKTVYQQVPLDALYKAYHAPGRLDEKYYTTELLSTALGLGKSSRLYQELIEDKKYFNTLGAYTTETLDPGLLVIVGRINEEVALEKAEEALEELIQAVQAKGLTTLELAKAKNHAETSWVYGAFDLEHRAEELALATLIGDTNLVNIKPRKLSEVSLEDINHTASRLLTPANSATLYYRRKT